MPNILCYSNSYSNFPGVCAPIISKHYGGAGGAGGDPGGLAGTRPERVRERAAQLPAAHGYLEHVRGPGDQDVRRVRRPGALPRAPRAR